MNRCLLLAEGTKEGAPSSQLEPRYGTPTMWTRLPGLSINLQVVLVFTLPAKEIAPVRDACAAAGDGLPQNRLGRLGQLLPFRKRQIAGGPPGIDGGAVENLTRINIADPGNGALIQEE